MGTDNRVNAPQDIEKDLALVSKSIGIAGVGGMAMPIRLERAPDVLLPDRLAVNVHIPLDAIRALTPPPQEQGYVVTATPSSAPDWKDSE